MARPFQKEIQLHFRDADPAGILFFGNVFGLAHDCFEDFIQAAGFTWQEWFHTKEYMVPIRHTDSNFLKPFLPGERYQIHAFVSKIGNSSFQMTYEFKNQQTTHAVVTMTHAFLKAQTKEKISVPTSIRERLQVHMHAN